MPAGARDRQRARDRRQLGVGAGSGHTSGPGGMGVLLLVCERSGACAARRAACTSNGGGPRWIRPGHFRQFDPQRPARGEHVAPRLTVVVEHSVMSVPDAVWRRLRRLPVQAACHEASRAATASPGENCLRSGLGNRSLACRPFQVVGFASFRAGQLAPCGTRDRSALAGRSPGSTRRCRRLTRCVRTFSSRSMTPFQVRRWFRLASPACRSSRCRPFYRVCVWALLFPPG